MKKPPYCPAPCCVTNDPSHELYGTSDFYIHKGSFHNNGRNTDIPKYRCRHCGKNFCSNTFKSTYRMRKTKHLPDLFHALTSGENYTEAAKQCKVDEKTVAANVKVLATMTRRKHAREMELGTHDTSFVQIDEMETSVISKSQKVSITLAVRKKTGAILSIVADRMPSNGHLAELGRNKYGWTHDFRKNCFMGAMSDIAAVAKNGFTVLTDGCRRYIPWIAAAVPAAHHKIFVMPKQNSKTKRTFDQMFALNNVCSKLRGSVKRLNRKTKTVSKDIGALNDHLMLFLAKNNGYELNFRS